MSNYICNIRCSYRQPSGYCGMTGGYETCQYRLVHQPNTVVGYVPPLKKTNYDSVVSKTPEKLAEWIAGDVLNLKGGALAMATEAWLDWLKQEADNGKD